jgi:hypothetical protein
MPRHFTTREEELFKVGAISFERLTTLLRQGVKGGLEDVALVEVGYVVARVLPFMLDVLKVVDSPAESPQCVRTRNEQRSCHTRFLCQNKVLITCVPKTFYSTHTDKKCSQIAKCHE